MASMKQMLLGASVILGAVLPSPALAHSEEDYDNMGPMGFMWPQDRQWVDDEVGMTGPCGTNEGPADRTEFPLTNGALSLEQKQNAYDVQVSISFDNDPTENSDFDVLIPQERMRLMGWSHVCIDLPSISLPAGAADAESTNATIRLRYTAEYVDPDHHHRRRDMVKRHMATNETWYSCADVTLVPAEVFAFDIPCFNATGNFESHSHGDHHDDDDDDDHDDDDDESGGSSALSKGAIAGIVVGSAVGATLVGIVAWYFCRKDRREKEIAERVMYEHDKTGGA